MSKITCVKCGCERRSSAYSNLTPGVCRSCTFNQGLKRYEIRKVLIAEARPDASLKAMRGRFLAKLK